MNKKKNRPEEFRIFDGFAIKTAEKKKTIADVTLWKKNQKLFHGKLKFFSLFSIEFD